MTVRELMDVLKGYPENHQVVLSKDAEGNDFSPLDEVSHEDYQADSSWSGELGVGRENAVCLWPVN